METEVAGVDRAHPAPQAKSRTGLTACCGDSQRALSGSPKCCNVP